MLASAAVGGLVGGEGGAKRSGDVGSRQGVFTGESSTVRERLETQLYNLQQYKIVGL